MTVRWNAVWMRTIQHLQGLPCQRYFFSNGTIIQTDHVEDSSSVWGWNWVLFLHLFLIAFRVSKERLDTLFTLFHLASLT